MRLRSKTVGRRHVCLLPAASFYRFLGRFLGRESQFGLQLPGFGLHLVQRHGWRFSCLVTILTRISVRMDAFVRFSSSIAWSSVCPENPATSSFRRSLSKLFMIFAPQFTLLFRDLRKGQQGLDSLYPDGRLTGCQHVRCRSGEHAGLRSVAGGLGNAVPACHRQANDTIQSLP